MKLTITGATEAIVKAISSLNLNCSIEIDVPAPKTKHQNKLSWIVVPNEDEPELKFFSRMEDNWRYARKEDLAFLVENDGKFRNMNAHFRAFTFNSTIGWETVNCGSKSCWVGVPKRVLVCGDID